MIYIQNSSHDPCFNQALEEYVFTNVPIEDSAVILWRNSPAVVCGAGQNVFAEVDTLAAHDLGVAVIRRESGGGAVYHDLGNVNYTFIRPAREGLDYASFIAPVVQALRSMGIPADMNRTSDIAVQGLKVSGSAQKQAGGRVLHHGTLLYSADLTMLRRLANGRRGEYTTKGAPSQPWPVTNMADVLGTGAPHVREFMGELERRLTRDAAPYVLTADDMAAIHQLASDKYASWAWTYGRCPSFTRTFALSLEGGTTVHMSSRHGIIGEITVENANSAMQRACGALTGARLEPAEIRAILADCGANPATWRQFF